MHRGLATRLDLAHAEDGSLWRAPRQLVGEAGDIISVVYWNGRASVKGGEATELRAEGIEGLWVGIVDEDGFSRRIVSCSHEARRKGGLGHDVFVKITDEKDEVGNSLQGLCFDIVSFACKCLERRGLQTNGCGILLLLFVYQISIDGQNRVFYSHFRMIFASTRKRELTSFALLNGTKLKLSCMVQGCSRRFPDWETCTKMIDGQPKSSTETRRGDGYLGIYIN